MVSRAATCEMVGALGIVMGLLDLTGVFITGALGSYFFGGAVAKAPAGAGSEAEHKLALVSPLMLRGI